jgi:UDP-N-acetyl-D-mannosaminuronic acid dehydrogenase
MTNVDNKNQMMKQSGPGADAAIIGLGYIGLPTAAIVASAGLRVVGVDIRKSIVETVSSGGIHIEEPDLDTLVKKVVAEGWLSASTDIPLADVFIIAVPTPCDDKHRPDVGSVLAASRALAPALRPGDLIILESTSPVGTTEQVCAAIAEARPDLRVPAVGGGETDIHVAYCPERVLPGRILAELVQNDRCVGGITAKCGEAAARFYRRFVEGECVVMSARTAEMVKLAENSFRDVNIAFANELSLAADALGIDVWEVIRIANRHPRVNILQPGPGVGGHCIAVDPWFLVHSAPEQTPLIRTAREVNDGKSDYVVERARALVASRPGATVACLGLAFKPDVDDFRESPALKVATRLASDFGNRVLVVEPHAAKLPPELEATGARLAPLSDALALAEVLVLLVDHREFLTMDKAELAGKAIYDTRGCLSKPAD